MIVGKVIGNIVSTQKESALIGMKLLIVELVSGIEAGKNIISVDLVGAGNGEFVLITNGSSARCALKNKEAPVDSVIVGIVDNFKEIEGNK